MKINLLDMMRTVLGPDLDETASQETVRQWDSLNHIRILLELQSQYHVHIAAGQVEKLTSFHAIEEFLREAVHQPPG